CPYTPLTRSRRGLASFGMALLKAPPRRPCYPRALRRATRINHDFAHPDDPVCGHAKVPTPSPDTKLTRTGLMRLGTPQGTSPQTVLPSRLASRHSHQPRLCAP